MSVSSRFEMPLSNQSQHTSNTSSRFQENVGKKCFLSLDWWRTWFGIEEHAIWDLHKAKVTKILRFWENNIDTKGLNFDTIFNKLRRQHFDTT